MQSFLNLPERTLKPRVSGITVLIDNGYSLGFYREIVESFSGLIDFIKLGWGTAYITPDKLLSEKIAIANDHDIKLFFGGSFFEKAYYQNKLTDFCRFVKSYQFEYMEISNGVIPLSNQEKAQIVAQLSGEFKILSEVGYKDDDKSQDFTSDQWLEAIRDDLKAGAVKVITESRETGSSGLCNKQGELKTDIVDDILTSEIENNSLIFEAPNKQLQTYFIKQFGSEVNLANIPFSDALALETLRLGLRGDTLMDFE